MSGAVVVARLLRAALPAAPLLDLGWPGWGFAPHWPGARLGLPDPDALPPGEAALLGRFRQGTGARPILGLDPVADAELLAGAAGALGSAEAPLLVLDGAPPAGLAPLLEGGAMLLRRSRTEAAAPPGVPRGRIMLLGGSLAQVERWDLLLPPDLVAPVFGRMQAAAQELAGAQGGSAAWQVGGRVARPDLASLGMLATGEAPVLPVALSAVELAHDLPGPPGADGLALGRTTRLRLLLGALPMRGARLRLRLRGADPARAPTLFLDGEAQATHLVAEAAGQVAEAVIRPRRDAAQVVGLALPPGAPPGLAVTGLEVLP
ncbi:hypothetical protein [Roseicella aquatilis]|uniref:Uncharacterized protein n=1 Tax=Roseicella aquatilis TaxID=2527868 RepID=A0A4R4DWG5_9PROT|nr:hypothetical protein [Roseicella aquatilis]TCZ66881.1 hypothetical protein EXY23_01885 [Roseicella aquatilis]